MSESEALRAYFDAHMGMHHASTEEAFGRLYVKANQARDRLLQLATRDDTPQRIGLEEAQDLGCFEPDEADKARV